MGVLALREECTNRTVHETEIEGKTMFAIFQQILEGRRTTTLARSISKSFFGYGRSVSKKVPTILVEFSVLLLANLRKLGQFFLQTSENGLQFRLLRLGRVGVRDPAEHLGESEKGTVRLR